jgi:pyruvate-formate lyase
MGTVCLQPGVGTFEGYLNNGMTCAASADGRRKCTTLGTDAADILAAMSGMSGSSTVFWNGAPVDRNISENSPPKELEQVIRAFANGTGSNIMTLTLANEETFQESVRQPERYDTVRFRMGGWTEFFSGLSDAHKQIHIRRPRDLMGAVRGVCPARYRNSTVATKGKKRKKEETETGRQIRQMKK